jgi:hypothetical protein
MIKICAFVPSLVVYNIPDKVPVLYSKQLEHGIIFLQDNAAPYCDQDVQSQLLAWGWEMLAYPPYSLDQSSRDYIFQHVGLNQQMP